MERKPDKGEASICLVCAWREHCTKRFTFTGQHCLEFTRDITLKPREEEPAPEKKT